MSTVVVICSRDADTRELYVTALRDSRLRAYGMSAFAQILALARSVRPAAVVVDVLADADWGICRALRSDVRTAGVPIIALTGWVSADRRYRDQAARCGCAAFIAKPTVPATVENTVERVIRGEHGIEVMSAFS